MSKMSSYVNEIFSFVVMFLLLAAVVSGQLNAHEGESEVADSKAAEVSHFRLEDE